MLEFPLSTYNSLGYVNRQMQIDTMSMATFGRKCSMGTYCFRGWVPDYYSREMEAGKKDTGAVAESLSVKTTHSKETELSWNETSKVTLPSYIA